MSFLSAALLLFFLMDPFGNLAMFQSILSRVPQERRRRTLVRELLAAYVILLAFLLLGKPMMSALGLNQPAITIAGGVVLFLIALNMVFPSLPLLGWEGQDEPFIVPLAMPLIAGPSTLASILLLVSKYPGRFGEWMGALTLAWLATAGIMLAGGWFLNRLGTKGTHALEKLTGMLLIMISVQMLVDGVLAVVQTMNAAPVAE